jgi:hypothetical protein
VTETPPPHDEHVPPDDGPPELTCWRCGNPHDPFQEYCLECGARLVPLPSEVRSSFLAAGSPLALWGVLLALLAIALVTAGIVLAARDDDNGGAGPATTGDDAPTTLPITDSTLPITTNELPATIEPPTTTTPTIPPLTTTTNMFPTTTQPTTTAATTTTTTTQQTTTQGTTTQGDGLTQWPPSRQSGWTVFIYSVRKSEGRSKAVAKANEAKAKGLPQVGIIDGDNYSSVTDGYYAVFSGIYDTKDQALSNRTLARQKGYTTAYEKHVVR